MSSGSLLNSRLLGKTILALVIIDSILLVQGIILTPTTVSSSGHGLLGLFAALVMLAVYGVLGVWCSRAVEKEYPKNLSVGSRFGLLIGCLFTAEMLLEYLLLPGSKGNERLAWLEFSGMFLFLFLSGFSGAQTADSIWQGVLTAVWSTLVGSLIWVGSLLGTYYSFLGSARQELVLAADQVFEDYKRSGMTDLRAFIMQDYLGGVFIHLLLGLIVAGILGTLGALTSRVFSRLRH